MRFWREARHNRRDINCTEWTQPTPWRDQRREVCAVCEVTGGFMALRNAELDRETRRSEQQRKAHAATTPAGEHVYWCTSNQVSGGECDCPRPAVKERQASGEGEAVIDLRPYQADLALTLSEADRGAGLDGSWHAIAVRLIGSRVMAQILMAAVEQGRAEAGRAVRAEAHEAALKQMRTLAHTAGWEAAMAYLRVSPEDQLKETAMPTHVWDIKAGSTIHITGVSGALEVVAMEYTDAGSVTTLTLRPRVG